jgi:hypothetical protein
MNIQAFNAAFNESRNGANAFYSHWYDPRFEYSDGVKDCAEAGCYWLIDMLATELPAVMIETGATQGIVSLIVKDNKGHVELTLEDDAPPVWKHELAYTDMPDGKFDFMLANESVRFALILITEH